MSLILEALRKLEREKQVPERGFLVLGGGGWTDAGGGRRPLALFVLGLLVGGASLGILLRSGPPASAVAVVEPAPTPVAPTPHAVPPTTTVVAAASAGPTAQPARPSMAAPSSLEPTATATAPAPTQTAPAFTLQAISQKNGHAVALINDRLLREGDAVDGARVARILADSVELEIGGRRVVLRF